MLSTNVVSQACCLLCAALPLSICVSPKSDGSPEMFFLFSICNYVCLAGREFCVRSPKIGGLTRSARQRASSNAPTALVYSVPAVRRESTGVQGIKGQAEGCGWWDLTTSCRGCNRYRGGSAGGEAAMSTDPSQRIGRQVIPTLQQYLLLWRNQPLYV